MKVIVFGGSGFVGSHVADALTVAGHEVTVYDKKKSPYLNKRQKMIVGDILDKTAVEKAVAGKDIVYHFAGVAGIKEAFENPEEAIRQNILGTLYILEACRKSKIKRFIFASTVYVCSRSGSVYRTTKRACEFLIEDYRQAYGLEYTVLRYGSLYGPRADMENGVYRMLYLALKEKQVKDFSGGPDDERKYIHVQDAARLSVKILEDEYKNHNLILTGKKSMKVKDLFKLVNQIVGRDISISYNPPDPILHYSKKYDDKLQLLAGKEIYAEDNLSFEDRLKEWVSHIRKI